MQNSENEADKITAEYAKWGDGNFVENFCTPFLYNAELLFLKGIFFMSTIPFIFVPFKRNEYFVDTKGQNRRVC